MPLMQTTGESYESMHKVRVDPTSGWRQRTHLGVAAGSAAHTSSPLLTGLASTAAVTFLSRVGIPLHIRVRTSVRKFALNTGQVAATSERGIVGCARDEGNGSEEVCSKQLHVLVGLTPDLRSCSCSLSNT